jgi:23S rRNA (guanosine2251-2'-O)-methyltransferase
VHSILLASGGTGGGEEDLERTLAEWFSGPGGRVPRPGVLVPPIQRVAARELTSRLQTLDHQGIAAEVDPYPYAGEDEILAGSTLLVALDEVQDPQNLGAIIRTAEAAGAGVLIPRHRAAEVTAAVVKASAGATEHAVVARVRNLADLLTAAKKRGFWVYGAAAEASNDYSAQDYSYPTCFVLGSEGQGLGRRVTSLCDVMVSLPLRGRVESLNVSVSAGVLLYEVLRQRGQQRGPEAGA